MKKDIPLTIEILSKEKDDKHRISSQNEIKFIMNYIAENVKRVALYYNYDNEFILTTLLYVDESGLWLEQSPNNADNKRIIESDRLIFVSTHLNVKVQFSTDSVRNAVHQGIPAFHMPLPHSLYRLQRREYYRLMTPKINPLRCIISTGSQPAGTKLQDFIIMDISCGGVGLTCKESDIELTPGASYPDCKIELPGVGMIEGTVEVKNLVVLTTASGHTQKRAGCEFKNLDPQSKIMLQRYVTNMQLIQAKT